MKEYSTKLFYSYCHLDEALRDEMEKSLALLKKNSQLEQWHDRKIVAGQKWSDEIRKELESSDIVVFIVTRNFLDSEACTEEWKLAKSLTNISLVSVIAGDCPWQDFDEMSNYQVLPKDGEVIDLWKNVDTAWKDVYGGLKILVEKLQGTFSLNQEFKQSLSSIEFCSQTKEITLLNDVFVFPQLYTYPQFAEMEKIVRDEDELLKDKLILIRGENQSGKSKLCVHLFLYLVESNKPALFIDLEEIKSKSPNQRIFEDKYKEEFTGDFDLWRKQKDTTIIFDNLTHNGHSLGHIALAKKMFSSVIVATSSDSYNAYFKDEKALSEFANFRIAHFSHTKQEQLIRKWLNLSADKSEASQESEHARIDKVERDVNSVLINNKVIPRYPFYILSILQTHEYFMPRDMKITAYGHCYHVLIVAHLIKSGIDSTDENINPCFNFASHLAFKIHASGSEKFRIDLIEYNNFIKEYNERFLRVKESLINRLCSDAGIIRISNDGFVDFSLPYSYYYFLGRHLADTYKENSNTLSSMMDKSYVRENTLALTFAIHHAKDPSILDEILIHTICEIDEVKPAKLDAKETEYFQKLLDIVPKKILSNKPVEDEREAERDVRDKFESRETDGEIEEDFDSNDGLNQIYKIQKNMEILSQILKNKAGILEKSKIEEIVQTICDAGLRLVSVVNVHDEEIEELARFVEKKYAGVVGFKKAGNYEDKIKGLSKALRFIIFFWTMINIEKIVSSICNPELREIIKTIRDNNNTPAFDMIYYFYSLDVAESFNTDQKEELERLVKKYGQKEMYFLHRVLSLRTQHYINTHRIKAPVKQSVLATLKVKNQVPPR